MPSENVERSRNGIPERPRFSVGEAIQNTLVSLAQKELPVLEERDEIVHAIQHNSRFILEADTGSGKSTVMPILALAEAQRRNPHGKVIVTQPRRSAAQSIATYLGETMGDVVGFRHGGEKSQVTENTKLEFVTEKILLNEITRGADNLLSGYDTIILDEVHERSVTIDILMPLLKKIQAEREQKGNPLKVVLTSATLDRDKMQAYFDGASHLEVEGKLFDVTEHFEEGSVDLEDIPEIAAEKAASIHKRGSQEPGDMLIFMPGVGEIEKTIALLKKQSVLTDDEVEFISLTGGAESSETVRKMYEPSDKRRIFVATNVAETSITIPSVRVVIDSGYMRQDIFDPATGISGLETRKHTQGNAKQRRGRAGRTATGNVHYLFTRDELAEREAHLPAEILRVDLVEQVLLMKQMGIDDVTHFDFLDHPGEEKINHALRTLHILGALDQQGQITETGEKMANLGIEPRYARMLVEAERLGCEDAVALVVGMMQNPKYDVFDRKFRTDIPISQKYEEFIIPGSDILTRLKIWNKYLEHNSSREERKEWEEANGLKTFALFTAANARKDILKKKDFKDKPIDLSDENMEKINHAVAMGFLDRLIVRRDNDYYTLDNTKIDIDNKNSVLSRTQPEAFLSGSLRRTERNRTFAGMNIAMSRKEADSIASLFGISLTKEEPQAVEKEVTPVTEQEPPKQPEKTVASPKPQEVMNHAPSEKITDHVQKEKEEEKKRTRIQKIKEAIKAFLRKLRLIH